MNILIDSDAIIAIFKKDDSNHDKAIIRAKKIKDDSQFISSLTIPESATVLSHIVSQPAAVKFLTKTRNEVNKKLYEEIPLSQELENLADQIFIAQKRKNTSWPDCLNMAIMKIHHLDAIFSFDKIYSQNKFRVLD